MTGQMRLSKTAGRRLPGALAAILMLALGAAAAGEEIVVALPGKVPLVMVKIAKGTFTMGSPESERGRGLHETPHQVTLTRDYYLGKFEVTQAQWQAVMGSNPSDFSWCGGDCPVEQISWDDVTGTGGFLARLNEHLTTTGQPGAGRMRLPTEAEWERAARGGTTTRFFYGDVLDCGDFCQACAIHAKFMWWCGTSSSNELHKVGGKRPNPFGLFDVQGSVWEWVQDWYGPYAGEPQTDPKGSATGSARVMRGGSFQYAAQYCRSANRSSNPPEKRDPHVGFRLAMSK